MLEKRDLFGIHEEALKRLEEDWPHDVLRYGIRTTSGSTGQPLIVVSDWKYFPLEIDAYLAGGQAGATVVCYASRLHMLSLALGALASEEGDCAYFLSPKDDTDRLSVIFKELEPACIGGFPTLVAQTLTKVGTAYPSILEIRLAGEMVSEAQRNIFTRYAPEARLEFTYASNEAGMISSFPCGYLPAGAYHPAPEVTVAIKNKDEDGIGEISVTKRMGDAVVLDDYRTGDAAREYPEVCPCGKPETFQILGRIGLDYLKVAGALLVRQEVERVVEGFPHVHDYLMYAGVVEDQGKLMGRLVLAVDADPEVDLEALRKHVTEELFLTPSRTLGELVEAGVFKPLSVVSEPPKRTSTKTIRLRPLSEYVGSK